MESINSRPDVNLILQKVAEQAVLTLVPQSNLYPSTHLTYQKRDFTGWLHRMTSRSRLIMATGIDYIPRPLIDGPDKGANLIFCKIDFYDKWI